MDAQSAVYNKKRRSVFSERLMTNLVTLLNT